MTILSVGPLAGEPEVCPKLDWSFTEAVAAHSQFAGVLAGFVLTIMAVLVALPNNAEKRAKALTLFAAAFFALAVDSVLFGSLAGDRTCIRLHAAGILASGLLAVGGALTFGGIAWLLDLSIDGAERKGALRTATIAAYGTQMTGVLLVTVTLYAFLEDLSIGGYWRHDRLPDWLILGYSVPLLVIIAIMMLGRSRDFDKQAQGIQRTSYCAIGYTLATVAVFGLVVSKPEHEWEPLVTTNVVYIVAGMTLVFPILVLLSLSRALPRRP